MDDKRIIRLVQTRPSEGLYQATQKYHSLVAAVAARILPGMAEDIEECVSDTFVAIWKHAGHLSPDTNLRAYLICVARNTAINRYKQLQRRHTLPLEDHILQMAAEDNVERDVLLHLEVDILLEVLADLPEPEREVMFRRHFLFEPVAEVARQTGLDAIAVKNKLYRVKERLKQALGEKGVTL